MNCTDRSNMHTRDSGALEKYLKEIRKIELLTPEQQNELVIKIRKGDTGAFEKLIKANLRFVVSVAVRYQRLGLGLADLVCEGNLGLLKAIEKFDETRGFKFISYAIWWVRQFITQALLRHSRMVRLPSNKIKSLRNIKKAREQLEHKYERQPSCEEIAEALEIETFKVQRALGLEMKQVSLYAPSGRNEEVLLLDVIEDKNTDLPDGNITNGELLGKKIPTLLGQLTKNQKQVIELYFGMDGKEELTLKEIGVNLQLSSERIRQIKDKALTRLKEANLVA